MNVRDYLMEKHMQDDTPEEFEAFCKTEQGRDIEFDDGGAFLNFKPKCTMALLAQLVARQEGCVAKNIRVYKKGEHTA